MLEEEIIVIEEETEEEIIMMEEAIEKVYPELQDKTITPTTEEQKIKADSGIYGLNEVTINPVTSIVDENIKSENIKSGISILGVDGNVTELVGEEITIQPEAEEQEYVPTVPANGFTKVKVKGTGGSINDYFTTTINGNNKYNFGIQHFIKKVPIVTINNVDTMASNFYNCKYLKEIILTGDTTKTTTWANAFGSSDNLTKITFLGIDTSKATNMSQMFNQCKKLTTLPEFSTASATNLSQMFYQCNALTTLPELDTSKATNMYGMFNGCSKITEIPFYDTSLATNLSYLFSGCSLLKTIPELDTSKATDTSNMFYNCNALISLPMLDMSSTQNITSVFYGTKNNFTEFGGFKNLGQNFLTSYSANNYYYKFDLSSCKALTEQSLINVLKNLYDIATKGCQVQQCVLGPTNLAKLTSVEGQQALVQAQSYGWTIS